MVSSVSEKISPARQKSYGIFLRCPRLSAGITTAMIQITATTPASVGVNQPVRMPPSRITGIISGSAAAVFGRRDPASEDAAEQDHRNHQRKRGVSGRENDLAQRRPRLAHAGGA